ncbi:MAG: DUF1295 domain-containing protein [Bacteroides sp.]
MDLQTFHSFLLAMSLTALVVFVALYFVRAGYGVFQSPRWGVAVNNRLAWVLMEAPVLGVMAVMWVLSPRRSELVPTIFFLLFAVHYVQRSFVFPLLMKGRSRMPVAILLMGAVFNLLNGFMQAEWLFYLSPAGSYGTEWLASAPFVVGTAMFLFGMGLNWHSDAVIRQLRRPGDRRHYLPSRGMYRYVTSANYLGELIEWAGWAVLTWSLSGLVFFWWTFANLVPRAHALWQRYRTEFGSAVGSRKRIFPFVY